MYCRRCVNDYFCLCIYCLHSSDALISNILQIVLYGLLTFPHLFKTCDLYYTRFNSSKMCMWRVEGVAVAEDTHMYYLSKE